MFKYDNNCYNGDIEEMIVATELIKNNIDVCKSLMNNRMYDFIIVSNGGNGKLYKIQVKSSNTFDGEKIVFNLKTTRLIQGKWIYKTYQNGEIDYLFCVNNITSDVFIFEPNDFINRTSITLRYDNTNKDNYYKNYLLSININKIRV